MSTIYDSAAPVSPEGSDTPGGSIRRWWKDIVDFIRSMTPPGETLYSTGQVTAGLNLTAGTNFTINEYAIRRTGRWVEGRIRITYTGPTVTSDNAGNFDDLLIFTIPDNLKPDWYSRMLQIQAFGVTQLFGTLSNTGQAWITHSAVPNYPVLTSGQELFVYLNHGIS